MKIPLATTSSAWTLRSSLSQIARVYHIAWGFIESDFPTFVIPNTAFGILGALSGHFSLETPSVISILSRLPVVIFFNLYSLLNFDLANQRCPESVEEDRINKPWRPVPSGMITPDQVRRVMLVTIPAALGFNYLLGVWKQGVFILILTWLYNDLRGGDEIVRDTIIAIAYGLFNNASLQLALGDAPVSAQGHAWTAMISSVIMTTMHVQDLKDQEGDRIRGRKSIPLVLGKDICRGFLAYFVVFWSFACSYFWALEAWMYILPLSLGTFIAFSVFCRRTPKEDAWTWRMWCLWTVIPYFLPVVSRGID